MLNSCADQNQVITVSGVAHSLVDAATLKVLESVSLSDTLYMTQGSHARMRVFLVTLFGPDHPTVLAMKELKT